MLRRNFLQLLGMPAMLGTTTAGPPKPTRRLFHSVQSGHWDDPLTWDVGEVPTPGSNVILLGHDITVSRPPDVATVNCLNGSSLLQDKSVPNLFEAWWEFIKQKPSYIFPAD